MSIKVHSHNSYSCSCLWHKIRTIRSVVHLCRKSRYRGFRYHAFCLSKRFPEFYVIFYIETQFSEACFDCIYWNHGFRPHKVNNSLKLSHHHPIYPQEMDFDWLISREFQCISVLGRVLHWDSFLSCLYKVARHFSVWQCWLA